MKVELIDTLLRLYGKGFGERFSHALSSQAKEGLKSPNLADWKTPALISFLGLLPRQRGRCLLQRGGNVTNRIWLGRCGLGTWRTQGYLLYIGALLPLPLFFRFDVLVTIHLHDPL